MADFDNLWDSLSFGNTDSGFGGGSLGSYGSFSGGGGGSDPSAATGSPANGENTGQDSNLANAWWRYIHPGMGGGEGVAGRDAVEYPDTPSWYTGQQAGLTGNQWQLGGMSTGNATNKSGVNPFGNPGVDQSPYTAPDSNQIAPWMNTPTVPGWKGNGDLTNGMVQTTGSGEDFNQQVNPDFLKSLQDQNLTYGHQDDPNGGNSYLNNLFDNTGKPIGPAWKTNPGSDDAFETAVDIGGAALGGVAGAQAAGAAYGGVAGAASDAGSLGAEATGATVGSVGQAVPAWAAGAASGAGSGFMGNAAKTGDFLSSFKAAGLGALTGGLAGGVDAAGALGVDDPMYAKPINSAVQSGLKAGITGQPIGAAVANSGITSGLSAGLNLGYNGVKSMDYGSGGDNPFAVDADSDLNVTGASRPAQPGFGLGDLGSAAMPTNPNAGNASYVSPDNMNGFSMNPNSAAWPGSPQDNPMKQQILSNRAKISGASVPQGGSNFDNMAGNLMGLYSAWQNKRNANNQIGQLQSLYGQNSPYAQQLSQTLLRQDAAAGRRSQVGPRSVELQARLAGLNAQMSPQLSKLYDAQGMDRDRMLGNLMRLGMGGPQGAGGFDWLKQQGSNLQNWWNPQPNQNGNGYGGNGTDQYGEGYGPQ